MPAPYLDNTNNLQDGPIGAPIQVTTHPGKQRPREELLSRSACVSWPSPPASILAPPLLAGFRVGHVVSVSGPTTVTRVSIYVDPGTRAESRGVLEARMGWRV